MRRISTLLATTALCLLAADAPAPAPQADNPPVTFRSDVLLGRVDAQVLDPSNHPIRDLRAQDFILRVDGRPQEIRNFQSEKAPVDVVMLLDVSRSMEPHVRRVASASHEALRVLGTQDRVAILVFDRFTRVRMPFSAPGQDAERELESVLDRESFEGGTDITRGLLDAASYVARNARRDVRRAIVIVTDDQTERNRNEAAVLGALTRADCVLSALIAPDALHTGAGNPRRSLIDEYGLRDVFGDLIPPGFGSYRLRGPRTQSAGTSEIANQSGGDSMDFNQGAAFEQTLVRIRERYALYFYLPDGVQPRESSTVEVELSNVVRQRYPRAEVRYRRSYLAPNRSGDTEAARPTRVNPPLPGQVPVVI